MTSPGAFKDLYSAFGRGADPDMPQEELKHIYKERLMQFHPDKRPGSAGELGARMTAQLNEAWDVLRDPEKRKAYDEVWRQQQEANLSPQAKADQLRRKGNELYSKARQIARGDDQLSNFAAVQESIKSYTAAMDSYTKALELVPTDFRIFSNRALCYAAVDQWSKAREDAEQCTRLKPDFMKGWFTLVKAHWQLGNPVVARQELQNGLAACPGNKELTDLQTDLDKDSPWNACRRPDNRSVSPAVTPGPSRNATPPTSRPVSPPLVAAGFAAAQGRQGRSPGGRAGAAATYGGPGVYAHTAPGDPQGQSRSPVGPRIPTAAVAAAASQLGCVPTPLEASGTFRTGNFGMATPSFAQGHGTLRSSYSPGPSERPGPAYTAPSVPSMAAQTYAGPSSRSPGPSARAGPGPDLDGTFSRSLTPPSARRSTSLRDMADSSRGPSRGPTPPRNR